MRSNPRHYIPLVVIHLRRTAETLPRSELLHEKARFYRRAVPPTNGSFEVCRRRSVFPSMKIGDYRLKTQTDLCAEFSRNANNHPASAARIGQWDFRCLARDQQETPNTTSQDGASVPISSTV